MVCLPIDNYAKYRFTRTRILPHHSPPAGFRSVPLNSLKSLQKIKTMIKNAVFCTITDYNTARNFSPALVEKGAINGCSSGKWISGVLPTPDFRHLSGVAVK